MWPSECGANTSLHLEGEDQRSLSVVTPLIGLESSDVANSVLPLAWFRARRGAGGSFASRQLHHVVVFMSARGAQEKAKRFSLRAPLV